MPLTVALMLIKFDQMETMLLVRNVRKNKVRKICQPSLFMLQPLAAK